MFTNLLVTLALSTTISFVSAVPAPPDTLQDKRQSGDISFQGGSDGGTLSSDMPIQCIEGCLLPLQTYFGGCVSNANSTLCDTLCEETLYDNFVACYDCLLYNGSQNLTRADAQQKLENVNAYCSNKTAASNPISETPSLTATATATGPFTLTWSGPNATLPTWTGLATFVAESGSSATIKTKTTIAASSKITPTPSTRSSSGTQASTVTPSAPAAASSTGAAFTERPINGVLGVAGLVGVLAFVLV